MNDDAQNYNTDANVDDGSCVLQDCNGICGPEAWLGDGTCDDGSYEYNGNSIYFNCDELNNDNGDCDVLGRTTETRPYPNNKIRIH